MNMTNSEIIREHRTAAKPMNQIKILADLNGCTNKEIAKILIEAGESVPTIFTGQTKGRKRTATITPETPEKEAFELQTEQPPLIRQETTVADLIAVLSTLPGDAVIMEGFNAVQMTVEHDLRTGKVKTLVSVGCR